MSCISSNEYNMDGRNLIFDIMNIEDVVYQTAVKINYLCPHCGKSYYMEKYSETTAVYYPPIYKDGVNINPDRNTTTTHCICMNCGKDFSFTR